MERKDSRRRALTGVATMSPEDRMSLESKIREGQRRHGKPFWEDGEILLAYVLSKSSDYQTKGGKSNYFKMSRAISEIYHLDRITGISRRKGGTEAMFKNKKLKMEELVRRYFHH